MARAPEQRQPQALRDIQEGGVCPLHPRSPQDAEKPSLTRASSISGAQLSDPGERYKSVNEFSGSSFLMMRNINVSKLFTRMRDMRTIG